LFSAGAARVTVYSVKSKYWLSSLPIVSAMTWQRFRACNSGLTVRVHALRDLLVVTVRVSESRR